LPNQNLFCPIIIQWPSGIEPEAEQGIKAINIDAGYA
jgi:hypothetical protein